MIFARGRNKSQSVRLAMVMLAAAPGGGLPRAEAQQGSFGDLVFQTMDALLNRTYKEALEALPPDEREQLRVAERAWIGYTEKNAVALKILGQKRGMSPDDLRSFYLVELQARREQLQQIAVPGSGAARKPTGADLERADGGLNATYQQCLARLVSDDAERLRDAQRAWVTFRDEHARASKRRSTAALLEVTATRGKLLAGFYLGGAPGAPPPLASGPKDAPRPATGGTGKEGGKTPDPFERAR